MSSQAWTVLRLLEWTTDFFRKRGSHSPRLDAEVLLAHARDCSRIELYTAFGEEPSEEQRVAFREMVRRRGEGMPVAQLVGHREFYSLKFRVNDQVLIPRPETEHLVVEALDLAKAIDHKPIRIADVGTGSGAIAVALAKHLPAAQIVAVDQSEAALEIARWNAEQHRVDDRIEFLSSDLLAAVDSAELFDLICSNPPYVSQDEWEALETTVREYEPIEALVAGPKGTEVIERLIEQAPPLLRSGGHLLLELSPMIADACQQLADRADDLTDIRFVKDLEGHRRILVATRS